MERPFNNRQAGAGFGLPVVYSLNIQPVKHPPQAPAQRLDIPNGYIMLIQKTAAREVAQHG
jgi:hypothetical protein